MGGSLPHLESGSGKLTRVEWGQLQEFNAPVITTDPSPARAVNLGKERERGDDANCVVAVPCKCNVQLWWCMIQ